MTETQDKHGTKRLQVEHRHPLIFSESYESNLQILRQFLEMCGNCPEDGTGLLYNESGEVVANIKPSTPLEALARSLTDAVNGDPQKGIR